MPSVEQEWTQAWRPPVDGVAEVFHARFVAHRYPPHVHQTWTVLIVDTGEVDYRIDRHRRTTAGATVTVLPPHVAHDGTTAKPDQPFTKRVIYLDEDVIPVGLVGSAVDGSTIDSPRLRRSADHLHRLLAEPTADLAVDEALLALVDQICGHLATRQRQPRSPDPDAAEALRAHLDSHLHQQQRLAEIGDMLGWDHRHLVRSFTATFGVPPHQYVLGRRIEQARDRLLEGVPPATVAAEVGFHDQAHLTRHFRAFTGTTPGRYATGRPRTGHSAPNCAGAR